jgi:transcriptional regulator of met regulon
VETEREREYCNALIDAQYALITGKAFLRAFGGQDVADEVKVLERAIQKVREVLDAG